MIRWFFKNFFLNTKTNKLKERVLTLMYGRTVWPTAASQRNRPFHAHEHECSSPYLSPLTVGCHVDGSSHRYGRSSLCDGQYLHGLPLWPPLSMPAQHGWVYALPGWICSESRVEPRIEKKGERKLWENQIFTTKEEEKKLKKGS